jgi:hypothetical protein
VVGQAAFNRRLRRAAPLVATILRALAIACPSWCDQWRTTLARSTRHSSMRLDDATEITELVSTTRLQVIGRYADWHDTPFTPDARRLILLAAHPRTMPLQAIYW